MKIDGLPRFFLQGRSQETPGLSGFAKGELLQAEVVSQKGELLTLKTQDGRTFTAKVQDGTVAEEGDVLRLAVTGRSESGELLVQVRKGALNAHELLKMLKTDVSREHLALANAFIKAGVVPTKQTMQELAALLGVHKNLTAEQAVFMRQNDMPINAQTIRAFQAFLQGQNGLGQSLTELGQVLDGLLAEADTAVQSSGQTDAARMPNEPVVRPAVPGQEGQPVGKAEANTVPVVNDGPVRAPQEGFVPKTGGEALPQADAGQPQAAMSAGPQVSELLPKETPPQAAQAQGTPQQTGPQIRTPVPAQAPQMVVPAQQGGDAAPDTPTAAPPQAQAADVGQPTVQGPPGQPSAPLPPPAVLPASQPSAPAAASAQPAPETQAAVTPQPDTALSARQVAGQAKAMLNALFHNVAGRSAGELSQTLAEAKTAKELANLTAFLERNADVLPQTARQAAARAVTLASGTLQLSEQMAPSVTVVSIPVTWQQHQTTAELFVWEDERRKGKKIDPANVTLFISLGTEHMGRVETLIQVVGKHVECTLSSDESNAVAFLAQHGDELGARLQEEGYRLVRMTTEQRVRPANLLTVQEEHRDKLRRARFDRSV